SGVFYAAKFFKRARTPLRPFEPVKSMITTGPFRFSRNPVYLFMFVLLVGWAISLGSLSPWFGVFWFIYIIRNYWIPAEEAQMEREMGAAYQEYKARVRRWF
ncbi:MAG: methyltransferase family protein, partial [Rickettsiales bacterium]